MSKSTDQQQHTTVSGSRAGQNTDSIRNMLKEQRKQCADLHANPLFQEFWQRSKQPHDPQPPVIDDLEAEGQNRLFDVIRSAAEARETDRAGVWASFGQPYACLGVPQQLDTSTAALLPHLNRDDIETAANGPKQQQQQQQQHRRGIVRMSRTGSAGPAPGAIAAAAAAAVAAAGEGKVAGGPNSHRSNTGNEADAATLLHHKTVMHFSTVDRLEASFPIAAVRQSDRRQKAAKVKPKRFFNKQRAEADLADAAASYGHHSIPSKTLPGQMLLQQHQTAAAAIARQSAARDAASAVSGRSKGSRVQPVSTAGGTDAGTATDGRHAFFITQQAPVSGVPTAAAAADSATDSIAAAAEASTASTAAAATAARRMSVSMSAADTDGTHGMASLRASAHTTSDNSASTLAHNSKSPRFGPITDPTMQPIGGSSSPVIAWHNDFVGVRHAGYAALQQTLWQRSQNRAHARGEPTAAALFSKGLLLQLAQTGGKFQPGWIPGTTPESPFAFATSQQQAQQAASSAAMAAEAAAAAGPRMKPAEVELLEQFYESLCSLVERQRLSDPLSLTLVHKVKGLLENGTFLQPAMLHGCIHCVANFSSSCGLKRYNRFMLPLLTFVRKCTGVSQAEFEAMAAAAGIEPVIYDLQPEEAPQQQEGDPMQQQQLGVVPEEGEVATTAAAAAADVAVAQQIVQRISIGGSNRGSSSGGSNASRPQSTAGRPLSTAGAAATPTPATAAAAASGTAAAGAAAASGTPGPASPTSPRRGSTAAAGPPALRLDRCVSTATSTGLGAARGRGSICSSSNSGSARGGSGSGATTGRARGASSLANKPPEGPSVPGINAAAAAAAAELKAAIHIAPASQRALAAMAAGTAAAIAATDGAVRVKVPGVAGPVELVSAAEAAAAAAAAGAGGKGSVRSERGAEGGGWEEGEGGEGKDVLPDLGVGEDGQPLSRKLRQQEGVESWGTVPGHSPRFVAAEETD